MKRTFARCLMPALALLACSSSRGKVPGTFSMDPHALGQHVAFLQPATGKLLRFATQDKQALSLTEVAPDEGQSIVAAATVPWLSPKHDAASSRPFQSSLALLMREPGDCGRTRLALLAPDAQPRAKTGVRWSEPWQKPVRLRAELGVAVLLPDNRPDPVAAPTTDPVDTASSGTGGGGAASCPMHQPEEDSIVLVDVSTDAQADQSSEAPLPGFRVPTAEAGLLDLSTLLIAPTGTNSRWLALASAATVVALRVDSPSVPTASGARSFELGASSQLNLKGRRVGAVRPPKLLFDTLVSRLFVWSPGSSEVLSLNLAAASTEATPPLTRLPLEAPPSDLALVSTGTSELLVTVAPAEGIGSSVTVFDLFDGTSRALTTSVHADSLLVLRGSSTTPDNVVLYASAPRGDESHALGISNADVLLRGPRSEPPLDPITVVSLEKPYRRLEQVDHDEDILLLQNQDGTAHVYNLADDTVTQLRGWTKDTTYIGAGAGIQRRFFGQDVTRDGKFVVRPYVKLGGGSMPTFEVPADVRTTASGQPAFFQFGESAYVFVHPGTLGLLTYYESRSQQPGSYTAVGFLAQGFAP